MKFKFGPNKWKMPNPKAAESGYETRQGEGAAARYERVESTYEKGTWRKLSKIKKPKKIPWQKKRKKGTATTPKPKPEDGSQKDTSTTPKN